MNLHRLFVSARTTALGCAALIAGLVCSHAHAQWLPDRAYTEGPGIRVGDLELHPGIAARAGYDTNVFRSEDNKVDSAILALTPHLNIKTLGRQRATEGEDAGGASGPMLPAIAFNAGLAGTLFYYFEETAPKNVEFDTEASVSILPDRPAGFDVGIVYARSTRPFTAYTGSNSNNQYARDQITPIGTFRVQSRSGVLKASIGYKPIFTLFESNAFNYLNSANHQIVAGAAWKFLPYTALVYDGNLTLTRYLDPVTSNAVIQLTDSERFQTRLGLNGSITRHLSLRALVGYAVVNSTSTVFDDKEDVIGEAVLRFGSQTNSAELGYQRDVQFSNLGTWLQQDRGYLRTSFLLARVVALVLEGGVAHVNYGRILSSTGAALGVDRETGDPTFNREDVRFDAGVHGEYRVTNWLALMADFTALVNRTDFQFAVGAPPYPAQFTTLQVFGGVRVHY
jgi:hypothetical protein